MLYRYLVVFLLVILGFQVSAQDPTAPSRKKGSSIIDDTTRQVYGPTTSKYFFEEDVFYNRNVTFFIDTASANFHRWNFVQRFNYLYQDLGNVGTAIRPIYFKAPSVIGVRSGAEVYDLYWDIERIRYFDTKSPYTNINVVLGGKGRSFTKVEFSRNINPRWNFGFNYRAILTDNQVPLRSGKGDRAVKGDYYNAFTSFHTKDSIYRVFMNFERTLHRVFETGGVDTSRLDSVGLKDYFHERVGVWLTSAESKDHRMNFHLHHQLQIGKALQVYHTLDRYRQKVKFLDDTKIDGRYFLFTDSLSDNNDLTRSDKTQDVQKFKTVRNEVGIKGNLSKLFYNGYYALRHYSMTYNRYWRLDSVQYSLGDESYLGGRMELNIDSVGLVNGWVEANQGGDLRIEGNIVSRWFDASIQQLLYKPSFIEQAYIGRHNKWNYSFDNPFQQIESSQINGNIHYRSKVLKVSPGITFTRLGNYVFLEHKHDSLGFHRILPNQSAGSQIWFSPELKLSVTLLRHITLSNQTIFTRFVENADSAIRVPEIFTNTQLSYANIFFNGNLDMHAGVDVHWHSDYYAPDYDPALRQFYNRPIGNREAYTYAYPIVDIFFNAKIKRGRIFFKYNNLLQIFGDTGYFATPEYPGQRNILDFGFDLSLYD